MLLVLINKVIFSVNEQLPSLQWNEKNCDHFVVNHSFRLKGIHNNNKWKVRVFSFLKWKNICLGKTMIIFNFIFIIVYIKNIKTVTYHYWLIICILIIWKLLLIQAPPLHSCPHLPTVTFIFKHVVSHIFQKNSNYFFSANLGF